ncbi:MAG: hypothetical protein JNK65_00160 [Deltaproteobacteria bacterium]|nr:hypothetical protein [Deltaproteobacteria bacterium]
MSIVIDSVRPNAACLNRNTSHASNDECVLEASFHLQNAEGESNTSVSETIPFHRQTGSDGPRFYLQVSTTPTNVSSLIAGHRFDPTRPDLQRDFNNILQVRTQFEPVRRVIMDSDPGHAQELSELFDDLINHIFLGEVEHPDAVQRASNTRLLQHLSSVSDAALVNLNLALGSFLLDNREWLNQQDLPGATRVERLVSVLHLSSELRHALQGSEEASLNNSQIHFQSQLISFLYQGDPASSEVLELFSSSVAQPARPEVIRPLMNVLRGLQSQSPFNETSEPRIRLNRLIQSFQRLSSSITLSQDQTPVLNTRTHELDWLAPVLEGAACLAGAGLVTWGAFSPVRAGDINPQYLIGGTIGGAGCAAVTSHLFSEILHFEDPLLADAISGGAGALLGLAIPLILHFATPTSPVDMRPPIEGRGPVISFGP